jgi:hypothetical protein
MYLVNKSLLAIFVPLAVEVWRLFAYHYGDKVEEDKISKYVEDTDKKGYVYLILGRKVENK